MIDRVSLQRWKVAEGAEPSAAHFNGFLDAVDRALRFTGDAKMSVSRVGRATFISGKGRGKSAKVQKWKLSTEPTTGGVALRWERGLIAGIEPKIDGVKISEVADDGRPPALEVPRSMLEGGTAHAFIRLTLNAESFAPTGAEMIAAATPAPEPFEAWKLAATVQLSDPDDADSALQAEPWLFHNIGFYPSLRTTSGKCRNWFWAQ